MPNPPKTLQHALPANSAVAAARKKLEAAGVKYILSCWIDMLGQPKTKPVPLSDFELLCAGKGPQFAVHSVSFVPELGPADTDQIPLPDLDTLTICPWDRACAWMVADLWWQDAPYNLCPRGALKRAIGAAAANGYAFYAGIEPEFITMRWRDGQPVKAFDNDPAPGEGLRPRRQAFGYDVEYSIDAMPFLGELIDILQELGWNLHDVVAEGAYSQFELDFHYTDVLAMADRFVFLRILLKEIAKKHGIFITFMPKPSLGDWRSGAHMNISVRPAGSGDGDARNLFEGADGNWDESVYHAVAGLLRHGGAHTAIACPTVNSYNGLVPRVGGFEGGVFTWAPTHMTYGMNNRSAMLRLPQSRFCIENRAADMCMNPYLAFAVSISAMSAGMTERLDPGKPLNRDLYVMSADELAGAGARRLPRNLLEAVEALRDDELAKRALGDAMHHSFLAYKADEWERYHQAVTDWEVREYLRLF
ncbi:MAG: glutamine synthetase family protein [Gammaproteobacteria bacterium]